MTKLKIRILLLILLTSFFSCSSGPDKDKLQKEVQEKLSSFQASLFEIEEFSRRGSYSYTNAGETNLLVYFKTQLKLAKDYKFNNWDQLGASSLISLLGATPKGIKGIKPEGNKTGDVLTIYGSQNYRQNNGKWVAHAQTPSQKELGKKEEKFVSDLEAEDELNLRYLPTYQQHLKRLTELTKKMQKNPENLDFLEQSLKGLLIEAEIRTHQDQDSQSIATALEGGEYHLFGKLIENNLSIKDNSYKTFETFGSLHNMDLVSRGQAIFGIAQGDLLEQNPNPELRAILSLYPEAIHIVTLKDSPVNNIADLERKRVNIGPDGSGSQINAIQVLEAHQIEAEEVQTFFFPLQKALEELREKRIDVLIFTGAYPYQPLEAFAKETTIKLISPDKKAMESLDRIKRLSLSIPKNTYAGQDKAYDTLGTTAVLFTSEKTPKKKVETLLSHLFQQQKSLSEKYAKAGAFSKKNGEKRHHDSIASGS